MKSKIFKSTPYKSEIEPVFISLHHTAFDKLLSHESVSYIVRGTVFSVETNTKLDFRKDFSDIDDAETYFEDMKKQHPISEIIMQKEVLTEIKLYV